MLVAHLDAGVLEGAEDVVVDAVMDIPVILVLAPGADGVLDDAGAELLDQHLRGGIGEHLVGAGDGLIERLLDFLGIAVVARADDEIDATVGLAREDHDLPGGELAVGDVDDLVVERVELGVEQADVLHNALGAAGLNIVAVADGLVHEKHHAGDEVAEQILHGQGDCQAEQAEHSQKRRDVEAEAAGDDHDGGELERDLDDLENEIGEARLHLGAGEHLAHDPHDDHDREDADHERDGGGEQIVPGEHALVQSDGAGDAFGGFLGGNQCLICHVKSSFPNQFL